MIKFHRLPAMMIAVAVGTSLVAAAAPAQARGQIAGWRGPGGGFIAGRQVDREPGLVEVRRGVRTAGGHGTKTRRTTSWGEGAIRNGVQRTYANGRTMTREGSITRNGDGSVSRSRSRSGPSGNSQSGWSTIYRTDDGYARERVASTSGGRGYQASKDVSVAPGLVTIDRNLTTNSGRSVSRSRTFERRR